MEFAFPTSRAGARQNHCEAAVPCDEYNTAVLELPKKDALPSKGLIRNEDVPVEAFISNRFGKHYA
ncbi:MAG: hypothetical protein WCQ44_09375 [Opitutaceae bacterium]